MKAPTIAVRAPRCDAEPLGADGVPGGWLRVLRRYMVFVAVANLVWEFAHLPLYTIWETGSPFELAFAAVHCTGGDLLIALSSVMLALFLVGQSGWPIRGHGRVVMLTIAFGLAYTVFSEWLNIEVREAWAYRDLMPVIPVIDAGLSPFMQWIVIPLAAFWWARRPFLREGVHERTTRTSTTLPGRDPLPPPATEIPGRHA